MVTLTELLIGVHLATGVSRRVREATLERARSFLAVAYDEFVAARLAALVTAARRAGRRASAFDAIVAATALTHDLTVWTGDGDFEVLAGLDPALRVHRG